MIVRVGSASIHDITSHSDDQDWTGQLPHSWKSVSDSKSTATCQPSS